VVRFRSFTPKVLSELKVTVMTALTYLPFQLAVVQRTTSAAVDPQATNPDSRATGVFLTAGHGTSDLEADPRPRTAHTTKEKRNHHERPEVFS
jgi:hypothetical protein